MKDIEMAKQIAYESQKCGARAYFVGGCVRDRLRGQMSGDIDIEIHGLGEDDLVKMLSELGKPLSVGKSFGIYSLAGYGIDIALPRTESATGKGHRDFDIRTDAFMGTKQAAIRRDFTVNALMEDVLTGEITDHFGGLADLRAKVLRHVNEDSFVEDPLRVLRLAQFAARFGFDVCPDTIALCKTIDLAPLSSERVWGELQKGLMSPKPSLFFETLRLCDALSPWFDEAAMLIGTKQNTNYHKEGDVWTHTMMVLDAAAQYRDKTTNPVAFMTSALFHDLGKIVATTEKDGVVHSYNHENEGLELTKKALFRITNEKAMIRYVLNMCALHMRPHILAGAKSSVKSTNKMFDSAIAPMDLVYLSLADTDGMLPKRDTSEAFAFLTQRLKVFEDVMSKPYVTGEDLVNAGLKPDENFRDILDYAHKLRLADTDKESALKQVVAYARKKYQ